MRTSSAVTIVPEAFTGLGTLKLPSAATVTGMGPTRTSMSASVWPHCLSTAVNQIVNLQLPAYGDAVAGGVGVGVEVGCRGLGPGSVAVGLDAPQLERLRARHAVDAVAASLSKGFPCRVDAFGRVEMRSQDVWCMVHPFVALELASSQSLITA